MAAFFRDGFGYTFHHENTDGSNFGSILKGFGCKMNSLRYGHIHSGVFFVMAINHDGSFLFFQVWNVSKLQTDDAPVQFLTNNALENYNRHFNHIVPNSHPNLVIFSSALQEEAAPRCMQNVRVGRKTAPTYAGANFTPIPDDFASFRYKSGGKSRPKETGGKGKSKAKAAVTADKEVVVAKKRKTRRVK